MPRVLIIDDEPGIRLALRRWFERQGCAVDDAATGDDAWAHLLRLTEHEALTPAVVICDMHLPGLSGNELLTRVRAQQPALVERFILTTGDAIDDAAPDSALARHQFVLQKPFDLATLRVMVERVIGGPL